MFLDGSRFAVSREHLSAIVGCMLTIARSTAACCIVRTVYNWQNITPDPTWLSVDNWYWRSWEVCIGIVAASIPPLRPGYRTFSTSLHSYFSRRATRKTSKFGGTKLNNHLDAHSDKQPIAQHKVAISEPTPLRMAAHAVSVEADRALRFGAGEEGFAMKSLPGDKRTADQGIKKTTQVDVDSSSQGSLGGMDFERERSQYFV